MLHPINLPAAVQHLIWIVNFQGRLIHALCNSSCRSNQILDEQWVLSIGNDLNLDADWLKKFCNWTFKEKTFIERMRLIADLDADMKALILSAFDHDILIENAYSDDPAKIDNPIGMSNLGPWPAVKDLVHCYFESFYNPALYKGRGYKIYDNGAQIQFDRNVYLEEFAAVNQDVVVCPMCDGYLGAPEVDHFLPKAQYPYLSCHPKNLVPICHDCNAPGVKHEKVPLSILAPNHTFDWFHPYVRNANTMYTIKFERLPDGLTPRLRNDDPQISVRLENFSELVNLPARWRNALSRKVRVTQRKLEGEIRRRNANLTDQELINKVEEWSENQQYEIGLEPFAIIEKAYLMSVLQRDPETFDELLIYSDPGMDVVSA